MIYFIQDLARTIGPLLASRDPGAIAIVLAYLRPIAIAERGNVSRIARAIGVSTRTVQRWHASQPEVAALIDSARSAKSAPNTTRLS